MRHITTDTYQMKRSILSFAGHISRGTSKSWRKFIADVIYGILASGSCILSRFADVLREDILKVNTVERMARKLAEDIPEQAIDNYLTMVKDMVRADGPVYVDDTDVIKPYGKAFEALGTVRDGSSIKKTNEKGYLVTEITALTRQTRQPISVHSHLYSAVSEDFKSVNEVTFDALKAVFPYFREATYVFDRGYDMNALYTFMYKHNAKFIIRITKDRNLYHKNKWFKATTLRDMYKGKFKCNVMFNGKLAECWVSCVNVQMTASRKWLKLVLVYGLSDNPMMLVTNRPVTSKKEANEVVKDYFMRWRIEEYFRFKKQDLGFENYRVRRLKAMNNLNQFISMAIGVLCMLAEKRTSSKLRIAIMREANGQKEEA